MIIRTSEAEQASFSLNEIQMVEQDRQPYFLDRFTLKVALENKSNSICYQMRHRDYDSQMFFGNLTQGKTQRGKKFIQIGCKRFVGINRTRLIRWAKAAK